MKMKMNEIMSHQLTVGGVTTSWFMFAGTPLCSAINYTPAKSDLLAVLMQYVG